jgi:hypothetical protein
MKTEDNSDITGTTAFKYLGPMFTDSGKCKEEELIRT